MNYSKILILIILIVVSSMIYKYYSSNSNNLNNSNNNKNKKSILEAFLGGGLSHNIPNYGHVGQNKPIYTLRQRAIKELPRIGSYHPESVYFKVGEMIRSIYPLNHISVAGGSIQAIEMLRNGELDLALVQENIFNDAITGKGFFKDKPVDNLSMISGLFYDLFMIVTFQNSGLTGWNDLRGHKIGLPGKKTASHQNFLKLVQAVGLDANKDMIYINVESPNRLANLLLRKEIDGIFLTSNSKNPYLINLARKMSLRFIGTSEIDDDIINLYFPLARKKMISTTNFYNNINTSAEIKSYGVREILVARKELSSRMVYDLTKSIYKNVQNLKFGVNNFLYTQHRNNQLDDAFMPTEMAFIEEKIPIHKGAKQYYIDEGWIRIEEVDSQGKIMSRLDEQGSKENQVSGIPSEWKLMESTQILDEKTNKEKRAKKEQIKINNQTTKLNDEIILTNQVQDQFVSENFLPAYDQFGLLEKHSLEI